MHHKIKMCKMDLIKELESDYAINEIIELIN